VQDLSSHPFEYQFDDLVHLALRIFRSVLYDGLVQMTDSRFVVHTISVDVVLKHGEDPRASIGEAETNGLFSASTGCVRVWPDMKMYTHLVISDKAMAWLTASGMCDANTDPSFT
jgi:hypothetical protein